MVAAAVKFIFKFLRLEKKPCAQGAQAASKGAPASKKAQKALNNRIHFVKAAPFAESLL
jgi:hypothetical protein